MLDKMTHITINEKEYPLCFTLNVMEAVQDKYGDIETWSNTISTKDGNYSIKDLIWTFQQFINEGIDIENEKKGENRDFVTHKQVGRLMTQIGQQNLSGLLMGVVSGSVTHKEAVDEDEKN